MGEMKLITLSSDFAVQSQGVGQMEAVILEINPGARVVHLMHGLPSFDIRTAAWAMESVLRIKSGIHVCVVDPGVGTKRKALAIETGRGDFLIGPDNGVLIPSARLLGGIKNAVSIENERYMHKPVSPIFHGRDIFAPAAAWLSNGVKMHSLGRRLNPERLVKAPYLEARFTKGKIKAEVIHINRFGSVHLNVLQPEFDRLGKKIGDKVPVSLGKKLIHIPFAKTFGDVAIGEALILKDDYSRIELAINQGSFSDRYKVKVGNAIILGE